MKRIILAVSASLLAISATPAFAQADEEAAAAEGDIIVTATRSETLLSKTPIAMTALNDEGLRNAGVTDARALSDVVPNLAITQNGDAVRISIRGVTSTDQTEKGDPSAAFLLDGIYIARPIEVLGSFYDLERVEVLRGPQGTLYGRNTTAGVINVISARPKDTFEAKADAYYGNLGAYGGTGVVNVPVGQGLGVRAAVNFERRDSPLIKDVAGPIPLHPQRKNLSGRLSFGGSLGDNFDFVIRGDYSKQTGAATVGAPLANFFPVLPTTPGVDPLYVSTSSRAQRSLGYAQSTPNERDNRFWGVMGEFTYDFGPVALTYLAGHRDGKRDELLNFRLFGSLNNPAFFIGDFKLDSHELRLAFGKDQPFHGQIGAYYFKEKSFIELNLGNPLSSIVVPGASGFAFPQGPTVARSKAVFGQFTYDLTEDLHVTAGIRYTNDFKSRDGATVVDFPTAAAGFCGAVRCILNENIAARKFNKTTWKVGVDYDAPGFGLVYANVSTGYKAGGFNDGCITGQGVGCSLTADALFYNPETLTSYEGGFKAKLAGGAVRIDASIFHYDYKGLQLSQVCCSPPQTLTRNAAVAKVDGVEVDAVLSPSENDTVDLGFSVINARYSDFQVTPAINFAGRPLDHAPKVTATAGYTHTFPLGNGGKVEASARTRLSSAYYMQDLNLPAQYRQPSFTKTDLTLTYKAADDRYYIQGFVKNLENEITLTAATSGLAAQTFIDDPRTYGVRAGFKF
jgi:iron complex outermembrane recepter protein